MEEKKKIEPFTIIFDILANWWVVLLGAVAAALLASVAAEVRYVPQFSTSATFVISERENLSAMSNLGIANEMAKTFEKVLQSNVMKKTIMEELGVEKIDADIHAEVVADTNLLILTVTDDSPKEAFDLIRTIMDHYSSVSFYALGDAVMSVLEEPQIPFYPNNPLNTRNASKKAFIFTVALMLGLLGLLSYMKDTIKREEDIEEKLDARGLGSVAYTRKYKTLKALLKRKKRALLMNDPLAEFGFVESYKKLAAKIEYEMMKKKEKILVVTSVAENEGKSTVAANIAIALAEQSKKVLLVEGDLRRPAQFLVFEKKPQEENEIGEYLKGNGKLKDVLMDSGVQNLYLMVGRNCYSSSTELLYSENMNNLMEFGRRTMDYVIIDSPPAGLMGDAEVLADFADAVMVVVKQNYVPAEDVNDVLDAFREHHSKVLGVMLNGVRTFSEMPVGNYYGRYGKYGKYEKDK